MTVATSGNLEICRLLIEKGANVNAEHPNEGTPLMLAAKGGHLEVFQFLIEKGADINVKTKYETLLMTAATSGNLEICRLLIEKGKDVNESLISQPPLYYAMNSRNSLEVCKFLIERGADVVHPNLLSNARQLNLPKIEELLIKNGARK
eukprot:TRINITY_DN764_c0_g1_i1.p3 TRINITY_DN764_c0_g1~~TRINITY_DN764_c0_g1_i1.p3  ORF type:complete len:149 (+),score=30.96 TRINITY_DN764_c0_g1_i1:669-1115(+)